MQKAIFETKYVGFAAMQFEVESRENQVDALYLLKDQELANADVRSNDLLQQAHPAQKRTGLLRIQ